MKIPKNAAQFIRRRHVIDLLSASSCGSLILLKYIEGRKYEIETTLNKIKAMFQKTSINSNKFFVLLATIEKIINCIDNNIIKYKE